MAATKLRENRLTPHRRFNGAATSKREVAVEFMMTLALFLFGMATSLLGYLVYNLPFAKDHMTVEVARAAYSGALVFGGFLLSGVAVAHVLVPAISLVRSILS
jgi:hypothetical protein